MSTRPAQPDRVTLAPGVPDLAALGADSVAELLGLEGELGTWGRARVLEADRAGSRTRLPLPGTPDEAGRVHERPRGAGTGQVWLERFGPAVRWRELLAIRFSSPASASVAERRWNLLCHLRAAGVVTPEPMAVGARGAGPLARTSFLVVREPEGGVLLAEWLRTTRDPRVRRLGLEALGAALARLLASGAVLPELDPAQVLVTGSEEAPGGDCTAKELAALGAVGGRKRRRLPEVVVTDVAGGTLARDWRTGDRRRLLERFARALIGEACSWRDLARLLLHARSARAELREDWRSLRDTTA